MLSKLQLHMHFIFLQLDLPFSLTFYRWILAQEHSLTLSDLMHITPDIHGTLRKMQDLVRKRDVITNDPELSVEEKELQVITESLLDFHLRSTRLKCTV